MNLKERSLTYAWFVALIGTLVSLFYSTILSHEPCSLCWYQRIALFPLAIQLGIAAYRQDTGFALYVYPLCFFGFAVAFYQSLLPILPGMSKTCGASGDCASHLPLFLGIPFPWFSAFGFVLIALLLCLRRLIN